LILYLDTSSLIKLYIAEEGSDEVHRLVRQSSLIATSVVAYPEARSALARLRREGSLTASGHETARAELDQDWTRYLALDVDQPVWRLAGDLAERHALRGFDSLHLASFLFLSSAGFDEEVRFSSFDGRLRDAAELHQEL
jgi:predicted nucleic acid-binding protein